MITVFDVETTGLVKKGLTYYNDYKLFPRIVQMAWWCDGELKSFIIYPNDFTITLEASKIHGITQEIALENGFQLIDVIEEFIQDCAFSDIIVGHNLYFDISVIKSEIYRLNDNNYKHMINKALDKNKRVDTMMKTIKFVDIYQENNPRIRKFPTLMELHIKLFNEPFLDSHNASSDVMATLRCYNKLVEKGII